MNRVLGCALLLCACGSDTAPPAPPAPTVPTAAVPAAVVPSVAGPSHLTITLARETLEETEVPASRVHLRITRGEHVEDHELGPIPECCETVITHGDDVATFEGWYAGGGHRLRLRREGDALVVYQVLFGEGMGVPTECDIRGDELLRVPVSGELTVEGPAATERLAALPDCTPAQLAALVEEEGE